MIEALRRWGGIAAVLLTRSATTAIIAVSPAFAAGGTNPLSEAPQLQAVITSALKQYAIPGAAIGVWTPRGQWTMAVGLADVASGRDMTRADHFGIRSITKSFTVTLVLQLVANSNGGISLDDPVARYLADLTDVPNGEAITLRELGNMTSGLFNYTADPAFQQAVGADPTRTWTVDELLDFALHSPSHPPTNFPPGQQYQYSNTNTLLLGKLVERLTGQPFTQVLEEQILTPLALRSTTYLTGTELPPPAASGYQGTDADGAPDRVVVDASGFSFAGAMSSVLRDLGRWGVALAEGSLLPPALQSERFVARSTADDPASPVYDRYGLGIGEVAGWWGHTGEGLGFEAAVFHQIDRNETFAVLLNASNAHDVPVAIFCQVLRVLGELPPVGSSRACETAGRNGTPAPN
jgi:D-alanyl-D-alanine carboxypeptidase